MFEASQDKDLKKICSQARRDLIKLEDRRHEKPKVCHWTSSPSASCVNSVNYPVFGRSSHKVKRTSDGVCIVDNAQGLHQSYDGQENQTSRCFEDTGQTPGVGYKDHDNVTSTGSMICSRTVYRQPRKHQEKENLSPFSRNLLPHPSRLKGKTEVKDQKPGRKRKWGVDIDCHLQQLKRKYHEFNWNSYGQGGQSQASDGYNVNEHDASSSSGTFVSQRVPTTPSQVGDDLHHTFYDDTSVFSSECNEKASFGHATKAKEETNLLFSHESCISPEPHHFVDQRFEKKRKGIFSNQLYSLDQSALKLPQKEGNNSEEEYFMNLFSTCRGRQDSFSNLNDPTNFEK